MEMFYALDDLERKLREVFETWPLYREFRYLGQESHVLIPTLLSLHCENCSREQLWEAEYTSFGHKKGFSEMKYTCRNCKRRMARFYFYWFAEKANSLFFKVGQYPPQVSEPPVDLGRRLNKVEFDFYRKSLSCRNFSYGLGALAYLRRVVESQMNGMLDLLAEVARESNFGPERLTKLEEVKKSKRFSDKVTFAAEIIPPTLRPGGQNPIDRLHDIASEGLHSRSEDECLDIFDRSRAVFEYVFRQLRIRKEEAEAFQESLNKLMAKRAPKS